MEHIKCSTPDFAEENVAKLIKLFPEVEGETGTVDLDKLRQVLSSKVIEGNVERYEFTWPGKRAAKAAASAATTKTLRPCREESVNFDTTENLYIEGDNLEVLKLLQTSYAGKVKMIYIDPPYNTGHDFVYRDKFSLTQKELEDEAGSFDEDGNRFEVNDSAEARYHSNWCSMMYPRLKLARNLLRDDGVLFMSIDDNEVVDLKKLADELFGENNFIATISCVNKPSGRSDDKYIATAHEYILIYRKTEAVEFGGFEPEEQIVSRYTKRDSSGRLYRDEDLRKRGTNDERINRPNLFYPFFYNQATGEIKIGNNEDETPNGCVRIVPMKTAEIEGSWRWGKETATADLQHLRAGYMENKGQWTIFEMQYLDERGEVKPTSVWTQKDVNSERGTEAFVGLGFGSRIFQNPKPVGTLYRLTKIANTQDSVVLDFFSGSATTAHAVMQLNAEDGGNRKFIMVQLPEPCAEDSEAAKAGYKNICEIGKERIRRAGKKIQDELSHTESRRHGDAEGGDLFDEAVKNGGEGLRASVSPCEKKIPDVGFRVLKLDSSSLNDTSATVSETDQKFANFDRIKEGRGSEDLLFQMLLETHIPLSDKIEKKTVGGNEVFFVSGVALVACLDAKAKMTTDFFIEIAKLKPGIAFFRDDAFADDSARTNLQQAFDQFSPSTAIKVI